MPNWTQTSITGAIEDIAHFDFNTVIPMPEEMRATLSLSGAIGLSGTLSGAIGLSRMPDWYRWKLDTNHVTITGAIEDIAHFKQTCLVDGVFDFNTVIPMPEEMRATLSLSGAIGLSLAGLLAALSALAGCQIGIDGHVITGAPNGTLATSDAGRKKTVALSVPSTPLGHRPYLFLKTW
jgi:hypothetical protein